MKKILVVGVVVLVAIAGYLFFTTEKSVEDQLADLSVAMTVEGNRTHEGELVVGAEEKILIKDGGKLTVNGNVTVDGGITCADGAATLVVNGDATINGLISCDLAAELNARESGSGVALVVTGALTMNENAEVVSNGSIQLVGDESDLATTRAELDRLYDEAGMIPEDGVNIGPFTDDVEVAYGSLRAEKEDNSRFTLIHSANAQPAPPPILLKGKFRFKTPPKGVKQIIVFYYPNASGFTLQDLSISGPDGRKGTDDKGASCNAKGADGENAFRFNAFAPNITVNSFTLTLGSGGEGGDAETKKDCDPGIAKAGKGGKAGNFRMVAGNKFEIKGTFTVNPGDGGAGGNATAQGKDGGPSEDGGDATATGGKGADNKKKLSVSGSVAGTNNVEIGDAVGGFGGGATALPGTGGHGIGCGQQGGDGGDATANAGDGGDAKIIVSGGARRAALASDIGGQGGLAEATAARGGNGGSCDPTGPGGKGGKGGDANAKEGKGGLGSNGRANDGIILDETGGDGGNGGDGCPEGKLGKGGKGDPQGADGKDGKNICVLPPPPPPTGLHLAPPPPPSGGNFIAVIMYNNDYIPIDQIRIAPPEELGCHEDHWHPNGAVAHSLMGNQYPDPNPNSCGYCTVSQCPIMEIPESELEMHL